MKAAHLRWVALAVRRRQLGYLTGGQAAERLERVAAVLRQRYAEEEDMRPFCAILPEMATGGVAAVEGFLGTWRDYLARNEF